MMLQLVQNYGESMKLKSNLLNSKIKTKEDLISTIRAVFENEIGFGVESVAIRYNEREPPRFFFGICGDTYEAIFKLSKKEELLFSRLFDKKNNLC